MFKNKAAKRRYVSAPITAISRYLKGVNRKMIHTTTNETLKKRLNPNDLGTITWTISIPTIIKLVDTLILMALLVAIASTYSFSVSGIVKHGQKLLAYLYLFEIAERIAAVAEQRYPRAKMATAFP